MLRWASDSGDAISPTSGVPTGASNRSGVSNGSSASLVALVERLRDRGYILLDTQWTTDHLKRFGAVDIPRSDYMDRLDRALALRSTFV